MTRTCLNPDCESEVIGVGVCLSCANSAWKPANTGVEVNGTVTEGWGGR